MHHCKITIPLTFFFLSLVLTSCNSTSNKKNKSTKAHIEYLTTLNLPFSSSCGDNLEVFDKDSIEKIITKLPNNLKFGGVVKRTKTFIALMLMDTRADYQIPYLTTITIKGKIIDKFKLFSEDCVEDEFYKTQANYFIDRNLKITQTDSSESYKRTNEGEIIKTSVVKSSHNYRFFVDTNGKIKKYGSY